MNRYLYHLAVQLKVTKGRCRIVQRVHFANIRLGRNPLSPPFVYIQTEVSATIPIKFLLIKCASFSCHFEGDVHLQASGTVWGQHCRMLILKLTLIPTHYALQATPQGKERYLLSFQ